LISFPIQLAAHRRADHRIRYSRPGTSRNRW